MKKNEDLNVTKNDLIEDKRKNLEEIESKNKKIEEFMMNDIEKAKQIGRLNQELSEKAFSE